MEPFKEKSIIKILTGMRRSGKSTLLHLYQNNLKESGVTEEQIIHINMENLENEKLKDYHTLNEYIQKRLLPNQRMYLFIDEIQEVDAFERLLSSLRLNENLDIYVTGSNSRMLSGELATLLSGRYVEISVYPFSFKEYLQYLPGEKNERFQQYLRSGGLPDAVDLEKDARYKYLEGIFNTVLLRDIVQRKQIADVSLLDSISRYLSDNISNPIAPKRLADYLTSSGRKSTPKTVESYLSAFSETFLVYPVHRYDLRGKEILQREKKYYFADIGLRQFLIDDQFRDLGRILENIVFLELKRRGYTVYTGKNKELEIDFVAKKGADIRYYQVSASVMDESILERELRPFSTLKDNYPKVLLTLDPLPMTGGGIIHKNIIDFLLEDPSSPASI